MKLRRYAVAEFAEKIPQVAQWSTSPEEGVTVEIYDLLNTDEVAIAQGDWPAPQLIVQRDHDTRTVAMLCATVATPVRSVSPIEIEFDDKSRLRAEDGLRFMGASLAILSQVPLRVVVANALFGSGGAIPGGPAFARGHHKDQPAAVEDVLSVRMPWPRGSVGHGAPFPA